MRILYQGVIGFDVNELQSTLIILGYNPGAIDGIFGVDKNGSRRPIQFQQDNGLAPDKVVGPITWEYLQRLITAYEIKFITSQAIHFTK